jgi:hypothetical protein
MGIWLLAHGGESISEDRSPREGVSESGRWFDPRVDRLGRLIGTASSNRP